MIPCRNRGIAVSESRKRPYNRGRFRERFDEPIGFAKEGVMSRICLLAMIVITSSLMGCASLLHDLQPHRMHRWNRHPAPSMDPEFTSTSPNHTPTIVLGQSPE